MNRDPYAIALSNALTEIQKVYPDINNSFLFTLSGNIITGDKETDQKTMDDVKKSFGNLKETAKTIGDLKRLLITGKNGNLTLSKIDDMYLVLGTSKSVNKSQIYAITHVIIPTILETFKDIDQPHLQLISSQKELVVDTLTGFFAGDSVQIDTEILGDWTKINDPSARVKAAITGEQYIQNVISQVHIETFGGNTTLCKVKEIDDQDVKGKNMIRIPDKLCKSLTIQKGDLVKVTPAD